MKGVHSKTRVAAAMQRGGLWALLVLAGGSARAELPLTGPAFRQADAAYKAFARGDYATAASRAREALRQRPDVQRLRELVEQAERAQACAREPASTGCGGQAAFDEAAAGYAAYAALDHRGAVQHAERAVALAPEHAPYRALLARAWQALGDPGQAERVLQSAGEALERDPVLADVLAEVRVQKARNAAFKGYESLAGEHFGEALESLRTATAAQPEVEAWAVLLAYAQLRSGNAALAESALPPLAADRAEDQGLAQVLLLRGMARQANGRPDAARQDYAAALAMPSASSADADERRLLVADQYLRARQPEAALQTLQGLAVPHRESVVARQRLVRWLALLDEPAPAPDFPGLVCDFDATPVACRLTPALAPADPAQRWATEAYERYGRADLAGAVSAAERAVVLAPENTAWQLLLLRALVASGRQDDAIGAATLALEEPQANGQIAALRGQLFRLKGQPALAQEDFAHALRLGGLPPELEVMVLAESGAVGAARDRFLQARGNGEFTQATAADLAYLALRVGDEPAALALFGQADAEQPPLPLAGKLDAAYVAQRLGEEATAIGFFHRAIDEAGARSGLDPQQLLEIRRAVSDLDRRWGVQASLIYRGYPGLSTGTQLLPADNGSVLQAGTEAYWRWTGYRNSAYAELYVRVFQTLRSGEGGLTGADSTVGAIGARWKPFSAAGLFLAIERVGGARGQKGDTLARIAYSAGEGGDFRADRPAWWTWQFYGETGRYLDARRDYATTELKLGRSYRLDPWGPTWVAWPHLVVAADSDSTVRHGTQWMAGPGLNLRYWFREDTYHAPRSYADWSVQYRFGIDGPQNAQGLLLRFSMNY